MIPFYDKVPAKKRSFLHIMDQKKPLLPLLTMLLFLFCHVSFAGSRVLMKGEAPVEAQQNVIGKMPVEGGELIERRMDFESLDYPGSGANGRHDPRSPGKP
ncbi:uncharacterized protein LOC110107134 isoform X2 [Dendrobium catenatum]|uniref:uncharacterized protein LOC110107134 isoform X2 n=1 Tax=Dendrobium catenatum TaxID=906689 RepID=UPI0009F5AE61|nr:uncharacterized protein LOC110107134 isoform X2 [Dendrobium catenatum]